MIEVITVPGTGEPSSIHGRPIGMLQAVTSLLDTTKFDCYQLDYPSSYGPFPIPNGIDYARSVRTGIDNLVARIRATDRRVGLIGYSQGSAVISRLLEHIAAGEYPDLEIEFAALIANPERADEISIDYRAGGSGIAGPHGDWPSHIPVIDVSNPDDPICCCPEDSPLRSFADLTAEFSFVDPIKWGRMLIARATYAHVAQDWWNIPAKRRWSRALNDALNYAVRGEHTSYAALGKHFPGTTHSYTTELANRLNKGNY